MPPLPPALKKVMAETVGALNSFIHEPILLPMFASDSSAPVSGDREVILLLFSWMIIKFRYPTAEYLTLCML